MALWYFSTPDSYRTKCSRFDIGRETGLWTVRRVANALVYCAPKIIKWPSGDYLMLIRDTFNNMEFPLLMVVTFEYHSQKTMVWFIFSTKIFNYFARCAIIDFYSLTAT
ncbi:hypothetical protein ILUMI_21532 [Ignelater luminosus]|uniref:Uncharacterized protein n=1 Tax=Ignelater luminosus TaxID=2038154 RepID=A0A8K0CBX8_IGNLU|nr:hypothetical protein ILUMI_21532 [Ignelater luminosus]